MIVLCVFFIPFFYFAKQHLNNSVDSNCQGLKSKKFSILHGL